MYIRLIKANKEDWKILKRHDYDTKDGKQYFYIEGPNGIYQDDDGNVYHFDTYDDALEELEYLRGEHNEDKKKVESEQKSVTMAWTGSAEEAEKLTSKYGLKYKLKEGEGSDPYLYIELFGNPTSIKNFVIEQGFGGDEEAAKEYVPDIFSL